MLKKVSKWEIYLGLVCLFFVLTNILWLKLDNTPPAWDQAAHLRVSFLFWEMLKGRGRSDFGTLIKEAYGYPPLVHIIVGLVTAVFGYSVDKASFVNSGFLVLLIVGVYVLTKEVYKSKKIAFWASFLVGLFPVTYQLSRSLLLDLPLSVSVMWGVWFFVKSEKLRKRKWSVLFILSLVTSSLIKLNGFIYYFPLFVWLGIDSFRRKSIDLIDDLFVYFCMYALLVGWWWVVNFKNIFSYLGGLAGQGEPLTDPMNLLKFDTWIHYIRLFAVHQVFLIPFLVGVVLIVGYFLKNKLSKNEKLLLFFVGINYVVFSVIKNKDFRFVTPFLIPVFTIFLARGLDGLGKRGGVLLKSGITGYLILVFLVNSFGFPFREGMCGQVSTFILGDFCALNFTGQYPVKKYRQDKWPHSQIVFDLIEEAGEVDKQQRVLVLINREEINDVNLNFYKTLTGADSFEIHGVDKWGNMDFDYILIPELGVEIAPFYDTQLEVRKKAIEVIWKDIDRYKLFEEYQLPDGVKLYLVKV